MAKRKAGVNDIIYELDNEDIVISSDDEVKKPKINLLDTGDITKPAKNEDITTGGRNEVSNVDNSIEDDIVKECTTKTHNGGKMSCDLENNLEEQAPSPQQVEIDIKKPSDCSKTTILNEDIVIDSPGNSDLGVEGCENRTPLVTVRFRDTKLAKSYKKHLKAFMLNLIKLHDGDNYESENETDIELDIWPEDLIDEPQDLFEDNTENNLFFVDTDPCGREAADVPTYSKLSTLISNIPDKEPSPPPTVTRKGPTCFNCDGNHPLRDCQLPRDNARIAEKRKNMAVRVGRYHVEDEQKYGHLIPGRISGKLRHALGLKRHELPLHIYRMRMLGYPPGWLEEARISHSGITLFDSAGNAILEPEEEEGELSEPGSKDKFDIKKILDFPGFNVPASPRYKEEAHLFGLPPMSEQDSKMAMLQMLAPNAMQAYKRKKLTFFPSTATGGIAQAGQAEMELDSGDEVVEFPSIPPLPDEAPPPPPPPPPPPESPAPVTPPPPTPLSPPSEQPLTNEIPEHETEDAEDDLKVINVIQIGDIPVPTPNLIIIDDDSDKPQSNGRRSPTLTELEQNKILLNALECETVLDSDEISIIDVKETQKEAKQGDTEIKHGDTETNHGDTETKRKGDNTNETNDQTTNVIVENKEINVEIDILMNTTEKSEHNGDEEPQSEEPTEKEPKGLEVQGEPNKTILPTTPSAQEHTNTSSPPDLTRTPDHKTGQVKTTNYGTPIMNVVSSYSKLPSDDKFSKDICDVINFENLPNSTGKYKQISVLLKKVKSEVDRIQES